MSSEPGTFRSGTVMKFSQGFCAGALCGCGAGWKARLLVAKGGYLFKFKSESSKAPSG